MPGGETMRRIPLMAAMPAAMAAAILLTTLASASAATQTAPTAALGPLDGTAWAVRVTPDEAAAKKGDKPFDDVMMFQAGRVSMSACLKYGFKPSKYTTVKSDGGWNVTTEQTSESAGKTVWNAVIAGDTIKGTLVSTKKDGTVLNYTFEGKKGSGK